MATYPSIIKLFMIHVTISTNDKRVQRYKKKKASLVNTIDEEKKNNEKVTSILYSQKL